MTFVIGQLAGVMRPGHAYREHLCPLELDHYPSFHARRFNRTACKPYGVVVWYNYRLLHI